MTDTPALPVLDLSRLEAGEAERQAFLTDLRDAARTSGFFYLTGHGVTAAEFKAIFDLSRRFFALPEAEKLSVQMIHSPQFRGYNRAGAELTRGAQDWREQYDFGPERPLLPLTPDSPPWARLQGPNLWPAALPEMKAGVIGWQDKLSALGIRLLEAFALSLGQPADAFAPIYREGAHARAKLIRYPGQEPGASEQGVGAHKDSGFLTLLAQDQVGGLQVETETGWIDAAPIPGAFVVNIGEILELASDGYLRATVHRVVSPPPGVERLSIAFFFGAALDASVPVLTLPAALKVQATGPATDPSNPLFREVGRNYLKSRLRSHPDVAARHYAELLASGA